MVISGLIQFLAKLMFLRRMFSMLTKFGTCLDARILVIISSCISKLMSFFWLMCLQKAGDCLIRYMDLTTVITIVHPILHGMQCWKQQVKLDLLSDIDMLLLCKRAIRGGLNGIGEKRYMKANNKYVDNFDEEKCVTSTYGLFWMSLTYTVEQWWKNCQMEDLNGQTSVWRRSCKHLRKMMLDNLLCLTWIILATYMTVTMIFLWLLKS